MKPVYLYTELPAEGALKADAAVRIKVAKSTHPNNGWSLAENHQKENRKNKAKTWQLRSTNALRIRNSSGLQNWRGKAEARNSERH